MVRAEKQRPQFQLRRLREKRRTRAKSSQENKSARLKLGRYYHTASLQLAVGRFRRSPAKKQGAPTMVGWLGWRKRAMTRWRLWSARRRQRPKAKEPSAESASTEVPADSGAVLAAMRNGDHALEHAAGGKGADREAVRAATQQSDGMTKAGYALKYASAGLRVGLTRRTAPSTAPLPPGRPQGVGKASCSKSSVASPPPPNGDRCVRHIHIDIRVPDCVQLPCVDIHVPDIAV